MKVYVCFACMDQDKTGFVLLSRREKLRTMEKHVCNVCMYVSYVFAFLECRRNVRNAQIDFISGHGQLTDRPGVVNVHVQIDGVHQEQRQIRAKKILLAVGGQPSTYVRLLTYSNCIAHVACY